MLSFELIQNQIVAVDEDDVVRAKIPYTSKKMSCKTFVSILAYHGIFGDCHYYPKKYYGDDKVTPDYEKCGDFLGISVAKARDIVTALMVKTFVDGKEKYINRLATEHYSDKKHIRSESIVNEITSHWEMIQAYENDGLEHMVGIALLIKLGPYEGKKLLGKNLWKKLHNNSKTRNDLIFKFLWKNQHGADSLEELVHQIRETNQYPSTILRKLPDSKNLLLLSKDDYCVDAPQKFKKFFSKRYLKDITPLSINQLTFTIMDCRNMAHQLDEPFDPKWSFRRMMREHDRLRKIQNALRYSSEPIDWLEDMPQVVVDEEHGTKAYLLTSPAEIAEHGREQSHCVGSYALQVRKQQYIVYKVVKDDKVYTFGCTVRTPDEADQDYFKYYAFQFLGFANSQIKDPDLLDFGFMTLREEIVKANEARIKEEK